MANGCYAIHVDSIIATWRSHRVPLFPRVRSMWQVYIDNLDVLEVCDWSDAQELSDSGHHEGMIIARERYKHFHVPRSLGKEVVRVLHTKALGDQVGGFQGVIGPPAIFVRELIHFTLVTLSPAQSGQEMDANPSRTLGESFPVQTRRYELFQRGVEIFVFLSW